MFNIAVMVSGSGSNLQAIIDNIDSGKIQANLALVISDNANAYALERAKAHHIPNLYIKKDVETTLEVLNNYNIDLIVLAGYLSIVDESIVNLYENRIINIHPSLIPKYSGKGFYGMNVHKAVVEAKETECGATVHYVDTGIDTGQVILQRKISVSTDDTAESLQKKVLEIEHQILPEAINIALEKLEEQDESNH